MSNCTIVEWLLGYPQLAVPSSPSNTQTTAASEFELLPTMSPNLLPERLIQRGDLSEKMLQGLPDLLQRYPSKPFLLDFHYRRIIHLISTLKVTNVASFHGALDTMFGFECQLVWELTSNALLYVSPARAPAHVIVDSVIATQDASLIGVEYQTEKVLASYETLSLEMLGEEVHLGCDAETGVKGLRAILANLLSWMTTENCKWGVLMTERKFYILLNCTGEANSNSPHMAVISQPITLSSKKDPLILLILFMLLDPDCTKSKLIEQLAIPVSAKISSHNPTPTKSGQQQQSSTPAHVISGQQQRQQPHRACKNYDPNFTRNSNFGHDRYRNKAAIAASVLEQVPSVMITGPYGFRAELQRLSLGSITAFTDSHLQKFCNAPPHSARNTLTPQSMSFSLQSSNAMTDATVNITGEVKCGYSGTAYTAKFGGLQLICKFANKGHEIEVLKEGQLYQANLKKLQGQVVPKCYGVFGGRGFAVILFEHAGRELTSFKQLTDSMKADLVSKLEAIHRAGVVHGDLEPRNILLTDNMQSLKVIDFAHGYRHECPGAESCTDFSDDQIYLNASYDL